MQSNDSINYVAYLCYGRDIFNRKDSDGKEPQCLQISMVFDLRSEETQIN